MIKLLRTRFAAPAALLFVLSACGGGERPGSASHAVVQPLPDKKRLAEAVDLLDRGQSAKARELLIKMLKKQPGDIVSRKLVEQIDRDAGAMLGSESYAYVVKPGETLRSIAGQNLGDELRFVSLAKYNHIEVPRSLAAGQTIRLPGKDPRVVTRIEPRPAPAPAPVKRSEARKKPAEAPHSEHAAAQVPAPAPQDNVRALKIRSVALVALNAGQVDRAVGLLRQAAAMAPGQPLIARDLARAERVRQTVKARQ